MEKFKEFLDCYLSAWRKYVDFSGRATRKDYWGFTLINILVSAVIGLVEMALDLDGFFGSLYTVAVLCPTISLCARRLHDVNKSGWWQLAGVVPILNLYMYYLLWIKVGTEGENRFGAAVAAKPVYGAYSVPVENEFSAHQMCPAPVVEAEPVVVEPTPAPAVEEPAVKHCSDCGAELGANAKFCTECGKPVEK